MATKTFLLRSLRQGMQQKQSDRFRSSLAEMQRLDLPPVDPETYGPAYLSIWQHLSSHPGALEQVA